MRSSVSGPTRMSSIKSAMPGAVHSGAYRRTMSCTRVSPSRNDTVMMSPRFHCVADRSAALSAPGPARRSGIQVKHHCFKLTIAGSSQGKQTGRPTRALKSLQVLQQVLQLRPLVSGQGPAVKRESRILVPAVRVAGNGRVEHEVVMVVARASDLDRDGR